VSRWNSADIDIPSLLVLARIGLFNIMPSLSSVSDVGRSTLCGDVRRRKASVPIEGLSLLPEKYVAVRASAASGWVSPAG
jgi:hypothetical protein